MHDDDRARCAHVAASSILTIESANADIEAAKLSAQRMFAHLDAQSSSIFGTTREAYRQIYRDNSDVAQLFDVTSQTITSVTAADLVEWHKASWQIRRTSVHLVDGRQDDRDRWLGERERIHFTDVIPPGIAIDKKHRTLAEVSKTTGNLAPRRVSYAIMIPVIWADAPLEIFPKLAACIVALEVRSLFEMRQIELCG